MLVVRDNGQGVLLGSCCCGSWVAGPISNGWLLQACSEGGWGLAFDAVVTTLVHNCLLLFYTPNCTSLCRAHTLGCIAGVGLFG
jgi:hypothetical protein